MPAPDQPDHGCQAEERSPAGRDHLPALREAEKYRPPVPEHRGAAGKRAGDVTRHEGRDQRRHEPFGNVEQDHRNREPRPEAPPDVRRADVPAADRPDVDAAGPAHHPVAEREAAGEVPGDDEGERFDGYFSGIAYFETQSFTVPQSRFSKNASM